MCRRQNALVHWCLLFVSSLLIQWRPENAQMRKKQWHISPTCLSKCIFNFNKIVLFLQPWLNQQKPTKGAKESNRTNYERELISWIFTNLNWRYCSLNLSWLLAVPNWFYLNYSWRQSDQKIYCWVIPNIYIAQPYLKVLVKSEKRWW